MLKLLLIFIGGGSGSIFRYLLGQLAHGYYATFACNIIGCFLIGLFNSQAARLGWSEEVRLMLTVGLCGGFTTFSTFSNESLALLQSGNILTFTAYITLSIVLGVLAVLAGSAV